MMPANLSGGCLCGASRLSFGDVIDSWYCHCETCRKGSGAPVSAWAQVGSDDLQLTGAPLSTHKTTGGNTRYFCSACGTTLYAQGSEDGRCNVAIGCLDNAHQIEPKLHRCVASQLHWLKMRDLMPDSLDANIPRIEEREYHRKPKDATVLATSNVSLREILKEDLGAVLLMDVRGGQFRYVAPNSFSLAQAQFDEHVWYRAIFADETPVGFLMTTIDQDDSEGQPTKGCPFLWRFMVDANYQGMGFGKRALQLAIAQEAKRAPGRDFWTSAVHGATGPKAFYISVGFEDTGVDDGRERILRFRHG